MRTTVWSCDICEAKTHDMTGIKTDVEGHLCFIPIFKADKHICNKCLDAIENRIKERKEQETSDSISEKEIDEAHEVYQTL